MPTPRAFHRPGKGGDQAWRADENGVSDLETFSPIRFVTPGKQLLQRRGTLARLDRTGQQQRDRLVNSSATRVVVHIATGVIIGGAIGRSTVHPIEHRGDFQQLGTDRQETFVKDFLGLCHGDALVDVTG
jgi:hypothetical protein